MHRNKVNPTGGARQLATLETAADRLDVSVKTVRRLISTGRLTGYRLVGQMIRVDLADVENMLAESVIPTAERSA